MSSKASLTSKKTVSVKCNTQTNHCNAASAVSEPPALTFSPSIPTLAESEEDLPTPSTVFIPLPHSCCLSAITDSDDNEIPTNTNGTETINMGSSKSGCILLVATPTLEALEDLWDYVLMNLDLQNITEATTKKVEFMRCFIKWMHLRAQISELGAKLYRKEWIVPHPDYPDVPGKFLE